jgi:hypothetical protein
MADDRNDGNERQITIRLPDALLSAIQSHQTRMRDTSRGVNVTTSDAVRSLILAGLSSEDEAR